MTGLVRRVAVWQVGPRSPRTQDVQDAIEDIAPRFPWSSATVLPPNWFRDQRVQHRPLGVGEVAQGGHLFKTPYVKPLFRTVSPSRGLADCDVHRRNETGGCRLRQRGAQGDQKKRNCRQGAHCNLSGFTEWECLPRARESRPRLPELSPFPGWCLEGLESSPGIHPHCPGSRRPRALEQDFHSPSPEQSN